MSYINKKLKISTFWWIVLIIGLSSHWKISENQVSENENHLNGGFSQWWLELLSVTSRYGRHNDNDDNNGDDYVDNKNDYHETDDKTADNNDDNDDAWLKSRGWICSL